MKTRHNGIQIKHATIKQARTIGILERSHASLKQSLKIMTGEQRILWHLLSPMAVLNYNPFYHSSLGCEASRVFNGRVPYNVLDLEYGLKCPPEALTNNEIAEGVLGQTKEIVNQTKQSLIQSYVRHKHYYDKKASHQPFPWYDFCYVLHPKAHSQTTKLPFRDYRWTGPYIVVITLPNNNYLIRNLQTNLAQLLHRISLRPFKSNHKLPDISITPKDLQQDNEVAIQHDDLFALAWQENYRPPMTTLRSQTTRTQCRTPWPRRKTALDTHAPDPKHEPQDVIDNDETQEDIPNLNTPLEPEDAIQTPKPPETGGRTMPTTMP